MSSSRAKQEKGKNNTFTQGNTKAGRAQLPAWGKAFKTGSPGAVSHSQPRPAELFKRQSWVCLTDERKEKSAGENCLLFYPGINSGSSSLLTSTRSLAVIFNFTSARCGLI